MTKPVKIVGADLSLNHGALIELTDGTLSNFWYYTDYAGSAAKSKKRGFRIPPAIFKHKDRHQLGTQRLAWLEHFFDKEVFMRALPDYLGIEDYALDGGGHGSHYTGEVGGIARILGWFRGFRMRYHDPVTLKMFAAHNGRADKDVMERAVMDRWDIDFSSLNQNKSPKAKKENRQTSQDLADAYALAKLIWLEVCLRAGRVRLQDLHEKEVRVFNRITKSYPVSLLDREWIQNPDGVPTPHGEPVCATCGSRKCCLAGDEVPF